MRTITINEQEYAEASGRAMKKFIECSDDENERMLNGMMFLAIQGMLFSELFRDAKEEYNA